MKKHTITEEEYKEIKALEKRKQNKRVSRRLQVLMLRYERKKDREIAEKLDHDRKRVSWLCAEFKRVGLEEYARHKYGGNNRNMTEEDEKVFLSKGNLYQPLSVTLSVVRNPIFPTFKALRFVHGDS